MANEEHLAILKQGVEAWNAWCREHNLGTPHSNRVDLRGANLHRVDLHDANLGWADLTGADLREVELAYAGLRRATLRDAKLAGADVYRLDAKGHPRPAWRWMDGPGGDAPHVGRPRSRGSGRHIRSPWERQGARFRAIRPRAVGEVPSTPDRSIQAPPPPGAGHI